MNREALERTFASTEIKQREAGFGRTLDYVEGASVIKRLNDAFEGEWSFDIVRYEVRDDVGEVFVLGKLTAEGVVKTQFGSSSITRTQEGNKIVSIGDDLKAAATDSLKKAATLFGVGLHLYIDQPSSQSQSGSQDDTQPTTRKRPGMGPGVLGARLSQKQHTYILNLLKDSGLTKAELNDHTREVYGVVLDHLTRNDASSLIEALMRGDIRSAGNGNGTRADSGEHHRQAV